MLGGSQGHANTHRILLFHFSFLTAWKVVCKSPESELFITMLFGDPSLSLNNADLALLNNLPTAELSVCNEHSEGRVMISLSYCLFFLNSAPLFLQSFVFFFQKEEKWARCRAGEEEGGGC